MPTDLDVAPAAGLADPWERARAARAVLAANAEATEQRGRPTAASLAAARDVGAFAVTTPARFGGLDADNRTMVRVFAELGAGCPSTSWLAAVSATAKSMFTDWMTAEAQEAFYTDPHVSICGTAMPTGRARTAAGGTRITGRWSYASGCLDSPWAMVGASVLDDEPTGQPHLVLLPTDELTVEHTWDGVAGLRGTGSHTLVADDVFVPDAFLMTPRQGPPSAARRMQVALHTVSPLLGAAKGALDVAGPLMTTDRPVFGTAYRRRVESPSARHLFAEAAHLVHAAEQRTLGVADVLDAAERAHPVSPVEFAHVRMQLMAAVQDCRHAVEKLLDLHGSSMFAAGNPLGRFWRDLAVGSRHGAVRPWVAADDYSRVLIDDGAAEPTPAADAGRA
ncbi:acyl-CoA dehydrogenase family protein [Pseudonocardia cypriaca]|uniref:Alkylation response protein AidB-like acyl-CoA dehydrogenase n=1 Tax=Pseudonocardia cypriaca TaxID=882449 RepID=A0A543GCB0_9PSEU|nr:acyl-CoA dehydrogenase family protein [Pseudonocardia cypriaca]TQM43711.1 alkylation response protein AidB-like acyl-CoA dehydrogenase [Pseudonocardia cypriaca]